MSGGGGVVIMPSSNNNNGNGSDNATVASGADALTQAAARGDVERVRELLNNGVHPDTRNKYGRTAIQTMSYTYSEIARILLEKGADPNVEDPDVGRTPLHDAVAYGTPGTVMCLLQGGADVTIKERLFGNTPVHIAAEEGKQQMLQPLALSSSLKEQNNERKTPYDLAIENGHLDVAEQILRLHRTSGLRLDHQCRLAIRQAATPPRLRRRMRELEPLVSTKLARYLVLHDDH